MSFRTVATSRGKLLTCGHPAAPGTGQCHDGLSEPAAQCRGSDFGLLSSAKQLSCHGKTKQKQKDNAIYKAEDF